MAVGIAGAVVVATSAGLALRWPLAGLVAALTTMGLAVYAVWRTAQTTAIVQRGLRAVADENGMLPMKSRTARVPLLAPAMGPVYALCGSADVARSRHQASDWGAQGVRGRQRSGHRRVD
jgi:hypothetical protein